jgi:hypothetical protein
VARIEIAPPILTGRFAVGTMNAGSRSRLKRIILEELLSVVE